MVYAVGRTKSDRFLLVYVFCECSTVHEQVRASALCKFHLNYKDANDRAFFPFGFAARYNVERNELRRPQKPTGEIARECRDLLDLPFRKEFNLQGARLYPELFETLRDIGFIDHTVLIQHQDKSRTLYKLVSDNGIGVIAEGVVSR